MSWKPKNLRVALQIGAHQVASGLSSLLNLSMNLYVCSLFSLAFSLASSSTSQAWSEGLYGEYFNAINFGDQPPIIRVDPQVNFNWGNDAPMEGIGTDLFSVRWRGWITASYSETYTLSVRSDDGVRVWVDGALIIQSWVNRAPQRDLVPLELTAGQPAFIQIEYFENRGGAVMELGWESPSQAFELIPTEALTPFDPNLNADPSVPSGVGITFERPFIAEGGETRLNAFRLGDLEEPLTLPVSWSGDALDRVQALPSEITIPAHHSVGSVIVRSVNDDQYQGSGSVIARLESPEMLEAEIFIGDDESTPEEPLYTVTGEILGEDADRFEIYALRIADGSAQDGEGDELVTQVTLSPGIYSLALPAGRYKVSAGGLRDELWADLTSEGVEEVEVEVPPHQFEINWSLPELPVEDTGEELAGEELAGEELAGEELAGEELAGEELTGEELAGEELAGEELAGEELAGEELAGEELAGEELAGEEESAGEEPAKDELNSMSPHVSGSSPSSCQAKPHASSLSLWLLTVIGVTLRRRYAQRSGS